MTHFDQLFGLSVPVTSTKVDVANWLQQVESKFKFQSILQKEKKKKKEKEKEKDNQYKLKIRKLS